MSRSQASSTSSSAPSWLQEFISAVTTQTNLALEHAARSDRTIEDLMERLDKQELRHQRVVDALQKQGAAAEATPLPGAAPSSPLPTSQPYGRLPSPPPPPKLTPDISLRDFRAWKATWEDYFELSNGPRLTDSHQLALLRTCLSPDMRATLGPTIPVRDKLADQLHYSAFSYFFPNLCLILENRCLVRLSLNFQERLLIPSSMPQFMVCLFLV